MNNDSFSVSLTCCEDQAVISEELSMLTAGQHAPSDSILAKNSTTLSLPTFL